MPTLNVVLSQWYAPYRFLSSFFFFLFTSLEGEFQRVKRNKHKKHGELRTSCACAKYGILQVSLFSSPHQTPPSPPPTTALNPDARPLSTYKTKMAVRTGKCSILTILRENRELRTVYFCLVLFLLDLLCVASRFLTWNAKRRAVTFLRFGIVQGCDAMVTLFCYLHGSCAPTRKQMWRPTLISELVKRVAVVLINQNSKKKYMLRARI